MKNLFFVFGLMAIIWGCKEEPPYINYDEPNTTIDTTWLKTSPSAAQVKQVLVEDFTGVKCANCPDATKITVALQDANPGRVNVVGIQLLNLQDPYTKPIDEDGHKSKQDMRTQAGSDIAINIVGIPSSLPSGDVNRVKFDDKPEILLSRTDWTAKTNAELTKPTPVNINLAWVTEINGKPVADNEIWVDVILEYTEALSDTNYLTIMLLEDSIIDVQEYVDYTPFPPVTSFNDNYVHMHVLRGIMTATTGDLINKKDAPLVPGRTFLKRYKYTVTNSLWKRKHMKAIAFVHKNNAAKDILQSVEVELH
jgi:hypothetical protein